MSDAARAYQRLFVPALFEQWTPLVAELAQIRPGERVLDVACGTGGLARHVAGRVGPGGQVVGVDPNPGMLAVAREQAPVIDWREGVAESLPFPDGSFDAVVSQFGLMFFSDRVGAPREMLRVLEADLRGWLPMVGIGLSEGTIGRVLAAADATLAGCVSTTADGIEFDLSAHLVCAGH